ncbi:unnamed protein product [Effrenium voratum]|uniref:Uncharacterized protein n=1 Tax=Effrenium voratum TaxID=2562239 RepID=A0AA36IFF4_9DINO|nr:unnamed protein product [Effrenium voratum]
MVLPTVLTNILSAHGRLGDAAWHYTEHARHVGPKKLQAAFAQSFTARFLHTGLKLETSWGLGSVGVQSSHRSLGMFCIDLAPNDWRMHLPQADHAQLTR